ncbi:hypothetical protein ACFL42_04370 [Candidatus Omnitrophota bacterium]
MGKYLSVIIGSAVALFGLSLLGKWLGNLLFVLKGAIPAVLIFGGVIAAIAGISEIKDELASRKEGEK